jgi:striatin 1/3/4
MSSNGPSSTAATGKPSLGRDPKSRARSRDYLKQYACSFKESFHFLIHHRCLQEIQYLTSPQALNPLPSRQLVTNPTLPVSLPNVPSFDQMGYNARPRKLMPDVGKDFSLLNNMNAISAPNPAAGPSSTGSQVTALERGPGMVSQQQQQQHSPLAQYQSTQSQSNQTAALQSGQTSDAEKDKEDAILDSHSRTSIFRPNDKGEWREKLGLPYAGTLADSAWDRRPREDDDDVKEDDAEVEDDESNVLGEGDGTKVWKTKRTLRK